MKLICSLFLILFCVTFSFSQKKPTVTKSEHASKISEQVEVPLKILKQPRPAYPTIKGSVHMQGTVLLKVEFRADGTIGKVVAVRGLPYGFTEKAIEAAQKIEFTPASKNGVAVTKMKTLEYSFTSY